MEVGLSWHSSEIILFKLIPLFHALKNAADDVLLMFFIMPAKYHKYQHCFLHTLTAYLGEIFFSSK